MNEVTMIHMVILALGAICGVLMEKAAVCLIRRRVNLLMLYRFSGSIGKTILWAMVNALGWLILVRINGLQSNTLECMLLLSVCMVLSAVDISIKKIPNELILMTLVIGASFLVTGQPIGSLGINIFGFVLGFIIFFLPAMIGKGAGWGDVKYAAAVGFCLGAYGILAAVLIMTLFLALYTVYIILTGKGSLKSKIALGPFMASGFVAVLVLNIINSNNSLFDLGVFING